MYRRSRDQVKTSKIITNKYDKDCTKGLFKMKEDSVMKGHKKIFKIRARLNCRKYSFTNHVVSAQNNLPDGVVDSETVVQFQDRLGKY